MHILFVLLTKLSEMVEQVWSFIQLNSIIVNNTLYTGFIPIYHSFSFSIFSSELTAINHAQQEILLLNNTNKANAFVTFCDLLAALDRGHSKLVKIFTINWKKWINFIKPVFCIGYLHHIRISGNEAANQLAKEARNISQTTLLKIAILFQVSYFGKTLSRRFTILRNRWKKNYFSLQNRTFSKNEDPMVQDLNVSAITVTLSHSLQNVYSTFFHFLDGSPWRIPF